MLRKFFFTVCVLFASLSFAQTEDSSISDKQLEQFANAYQVVQQESMKIQQQMMGVIQETGLQPQRFNEMYQASNNPNKEVEATEEEKKKFESALAKIESMQKTIQASMEEKIKSSGIEMKLYESIMAKMQSSPELQQRLQSIMMKSGSSQ